MTQITMLPEREQSRETFYPTPLDLAYKMLKDVEWAHIQSILEPSAGKGDLAEGIVRAMVSYEPRIFSSLYSVDYHDGKSTRRYHYDKADIDCIEIDPNLQAILKEKGFRVVHHDFMTFHTYKRYDLVVMNPPFDRGAEHLLKALDIQKNGGAVVCLLNAETIKNPHSYIRQQLMRVLNEHCAEIRYVKDAFAGAERKTGVEIAIVKCVIPRVAQEDGAILQNLRKDTMENKRPHSEIEETFLAKNHFVEAIVDTFNFEVSAGMRLLREYETLRPCLKRKIKGDDAPILQVTLRNSGHHGMTYDAGENQFIQEMRKKYWEALFQREEFVQGLTSNLRDELYSSVEKLKDYDFSVFNILQLQVDMSQKVIGGIEKTIMDLYDDWTHKHHWDENSQNRHYFDGWRTNDAFAVNRKVIIPFYDAFSQWDGRLEYGYQAEKKLSDIEKVFDYLDGRIALDEYSVTGVLNAAKTAGQTKKVQFKHFMATFYKKGTCHIEFTNMDVLHKFNLFAAKGKNWLPPCYGRKAYQDMSGEERAVVDSFEGEKSYEHVMARADYFLSSPADDGLLRLGA